MKRLIAVLINKKYFYMVNYNSQFEESLCAMEIKYLLQEEVSNKYLFSDIYIEPSRSPFIKEMICIMYEENSLDEIINRIIEDKLAYDDFKVCYLRLEKNEISYKERLDSLRSIGMSIEGEANIHEPKVMFGVTKVDGKWIFGEYKKNDFKWHIHDEKPYSYSNSLSLRVARALVNIAVGIDLNKRLVDPCCGVGTVVLEAMSMGIDVEGYEINYDIAENAKKNIKFFEYKNVIKNADMNTIDKKYDVAIIDMPYNLFTPITLENQIKIINTSRRITKKLVIVTFEDMDKYIIDAGFKIIDRCNVAKGKFVRRISICE